LRHAFGTKNLKIRCAFIGVLATWIAWKPKCVVLCIFDNVKQVFTAVIILKLLACNLLVYFGNDHLPSLF